MDSQQKTTRQEGVDTWILDLVQGMPTGGEGRTSTLLLFTVGKPVRYISEVAWARGGEQDVTGLDDGCNLRGDLGKATKNS